MSTAPKLIGSSFDTDQIAARSRSAQSSLSSQNLPGLSSRPASSWRLPGSIRRRRTPRVMHASFPLRALPMRIA